MVNCPKALNYHAKDSMMMPLLYPNTMVQWIGFQLQLLWIKFHLDSLERYLSDILNKFGFFSTYFSPFFPFISASEMGYVCNFLIRSLGILVEIIVLSDKKKTNNSVQMTKLQRLIKTYLHYVGDSDLITNKFLLIDTLVNTNVKKYIKRQENQTNSPAWLFLFFLFIPSSHNPLILYSLNIY